MQEEAETDRVGSKAKTDMNNAMEEEADALPAHQLLDFDWKLKYAVSSDSIAALNQPIARLELSLSPNPVVVQKPSLPSTNVGQETPRIVVAEYNKIELDELISQLESLVQAVGGIENNA